MPIGAVPSPLDSLAQIAGPGGRMSDSTAEAAEEFEAWMVGMLAKQMRSTVKDGPWSSGAGATFADLFDQEIGKRVAENGGFGLQESVLKSLRAREGGGEPSAQPNAGRHAAAAHPLLPHDRPADRSVGPLQSLLHGVGRVTSAFGVRHDPFTGAAKSHHGVDLGAAEGTPIAAAAGGVVRFAGKRGGYGNVVILAHPDGTETRYGHCKELSVKVGQQVAAGEAIASVGSTGRSTGPHLHFEVRQNGAPIDPKIWLAGAESAQAPLKATDSTPVR